MTAVYRRAPDHRRGYRLQRAEVIALEQKLPFVHLVESAGGDLLNYTVEGFSRAGHRSATWRN